MNQLFRKLPLGVKFVLIGAIPVAFIIYLSARIYNYESDKVKLVERYVVSIRQAEQVSNVINEMQRERRYSFQYAIKRDGSEELKAQRSITDSAITVLQKVDSVFLVDFTTYTFLDYLGEMRKQIDSFKIRPDAIMDYYTNVIYRLDAFNDIPSEKVAFIQPAYQDLLSQKLLSEMATLYGLMRWNVYNAIYSKKDVASLYKSDNAFSVYQTYETEFISKGSPNSVQKYKKLMAGSELKTTLDYLEKATKDLKPDITYTADQWEAISTKAVEQLKAIQKETWTDADTKLKSIYQREKSGRIKTIILLIALLAFVLIIIIYALKSVTNVLEKIRHAATKIARGEPIERFKDMPADAIGNLARCITEINESNKELALAAEAIGKGNFQVPVKLRSQYDMLGNAITQMKNNLSQATRLNEELLRKKDEFMSVASHELKTPLTSIKGAMQIIEMISAKDESMVSIHILIQKAISQANKLITITNDLLDITKLQKGHLELHLAEFTSGQLLQDCNEMVKYSLEDHTIRMEGDMSLKMHADKHRLEQVVINFLTNAIKYSADETVVTMKAEKTEGGIKISVTDEGIGIPKEDLPNVFNRFFRTEEAKNFAGLGLGLYICAEIIKRHNGQIGADSEIGKGSTFWFVIPE
jgi:signal transduction histidine kinase